MSGLIQFIFHIDKELIRLVAEYGFFVYGILFSVVFLETGVVLTPFLPGDSLLFAAGALASQGSLRLDLLLLILSAAAILGDTANYWIGHALGPRMFRSERSRWLNKEHIARTHAFFEKYGGMTIILARFVPIIRTVAPFVAGLGRMSYWTFISYNIIGGLLWVGLFTVGGYFFGRLRFVQEHFSVIVLGIIVLSLVPAIMEFFRHRRQKAGSKQRANVLEERSSPSDHNGTFDE